ncbi:MAG: acetyl-CoA carboxylase biotin carboxyl carrier protein subunit [Bacteroidales bacterium]|jgi:biotin carboxyl carrier protein|nr:acetyl-CoA carboxylase biotin carboxyl carrier protein subunit [Bacteroidales bacterium]
MKTFKFKINDKNYDAEVVNVEENILTLNLNGTEYKVELEENLQAPKPVVKKVVPVATPSAYPTTPASIANSADTSTSLKSPLPGTILDIFCKVGDNVNAGQKVILLEAMKMENNIEADKAGIIKEIKVLKGDAVMEGDVLLLIA